MACVDSREVSSPGSYVERVRVTRSWALGYDDSRRVLDGMVLQIGRTRDPSGLGLVADQVLADEPLFTRVGVSLELASVSIAFLLSRLHGPWSMDVVSLGNGRWLGWVEKPQVRSLGQAPSHFTARLAWNVSFRNASDIGDGGECNVNLSNRSTTPSS